MCGLAGWNVSQEFAEQVLTKEVTEKLVKLGFVKNLHRGLDAAGWMAHDPEDENALTYWKAAGSAADTVLNKNVITPWPKPHASAVSLHTRAKTSFTASDNDNNHPVIAGGVAVTHNGNIRNHNTIRQRMTLGHSVSVDSWVIAAALAKHYWDASEKDLEPVKEICESLQGSFVFAAMFNNDVPYTMLAVGEGRQVWMARYKDAIFYASEPEALYAMVSCLPDASKFRFGPLKPGQVNILLHGRVVHGINFLPESVQDEMFTRIRVDDSVEWRMDENNTKYHWTNEKAPLSLYDEPDDFTVELEGYKDENDKNVYPLSWPPGYFAADRIFAWTPDGDLNYKHVDSRFYLLFGDIEIVTTGTGTTKDIYNWREIPLDVRHSSIFWQEYQPEAYLELSTKTNLKVETKFTFNQTGKIIAERKQKREERERKDKESKSSSESIVRVPPFTRTSASKRDARLPENIQKLPIVTTYKDNDPEPIVRIGAMPLTYHESQFWMVWKQNRFCNTHKKWYDGHANPSTCVMCIKGAIETMINARDIDDFLTIYGSEAVKVYNEQGGEQLVNHQHVWRKFGFRHFEMLQWSMPLAEKCLSCNATRKIDFGATDQPFSTIIESHANALSS